MTPHDFPVLEGGFNIRDLGGLPTQDGRVVRPGRLIRSGTLSDLTVRDVGALKSYGIEGIFDLRSTREQLAYPNPVIGKPVEPWRLPENEHVGEPGKLVERIGISPEHTHGVVCESYSAFPYAYKMAYRGVFATLARNQTPLIFHCAYGKDRTGIGAALVLSALGVTREAVTQDYMRSNDALEGFKERFLRDSHTAAARDLDPAIWYPVAIADPSYLDAMFDSIARRDGTIERYLEVEMGVDRAMQERLKDTLLVAA